MNNVTEERVSATGGGSLFGSTSAPSFSAGGGSIADLKRAAREAEELAAKLAEEGAREEDPYAGLSPKERRAAQRAARRLKGSFEQYTHLMAIKPREGYMFHSDYFKVDDGVGTIVGYFHDDEARDDFGAFWGINRIPSGLGEGVSVVVFEQIRRMGEKWVTDRISTVEKLEKMEEGEQSSTGTASSRRKAQKVSEDIEIATGELQDGASYLHVHNRLLIKADSLERLDEALERISRLYTDRFGTLRVAAYPGEQRGELGAVFRKNEKKRGKGQHFTSAELAGAHWLVTNGLNDPAGEYVGRMRGDVNTSAVLLDVNRYEHHVVVADNTIFPGLGRPHMADLWGSKIAQSALISDARVVHLVLDGADMDTLGPKFNRISSRLDMNSGDINMFEMFGEVSDELSIFPAHLEKIVLMAEQAYETTDQDRSIIRGSLSETLTQFYIDKNMWHRNAQDNRSRLRVVGVPHGDVPRLQDIYTYFQTEYAALANSSARDDEMLHAYNVLRLVFKNLLDNNGDLFNTYTADAIDGVNDARRVLYDFSKIMRRGKGIAMAQLVNTVGFAVDSLGLGDTVIIHGTEHIDKGVKEYITTQFERLFARGGRVVYLYNDIEKMLGDSAFNKFGSADYTILGSMSAAVVGDYQKQLAQVIPPDLEKLVTDKVAGSAYLRRGVTNVVFEADLALGLNPKRKDRWDAIYAQMAQEDVTARAQREAEERRRSQQAATQRAPQKPGIPRQTAPQTEAARPLRRRLLGGR